MELTINLDIHADREPELFAGIVAIPEVCRLDVIRSLLELAIRTPAHAVVTHSAEFDNTAQRAPGAVINKRLSFRSQRTEDSALYGYFAKINAGRRKQTVRSLLMLGLIIERSGINVAKPPAPATDVQQSTLPLAAAPVVPQVSQLATEVQPTSPVTAQAPAPAIMAAPMPSAAPQVPAPYSPADDALDELFGACQMGG